MRAPLTDAEQQAVNESAARVKARIMGPREPFVHTTHSIWCRHLRDIGALTPSYAECVGAGHCVAKDDKKEAA